MKELQLDTKYFRIMACALVNTSNSDYAILGTSSGHLILCNINL